ncbi:MAG: T9SS type A sorting domain-containing protein [Chloroflexota bacterium]
MKYILTISVLLSSLFFGETSFSQWTLANGPYGSPLEYITALNNKLISSNKQLLAQETYLYSSNRENIYWNRVNKLPRINGFYTKENDLYAATENGIYLTTDEGATWEKAYENIPNPSVSALCIAGKTVLAASDGIGYLYISNENGTNWSKPKRNGERIFGVSCLAATPNGDTVVVGFYNQPTGMIISYNNGNTWDTLFTSQSSANFTFYSIGFIEGDLIATGDKGIFLSRDGGKNWVTSSPGYGIDKIFKVNDLYAAFSYGSRKIIIFNKNANNTFTPIRYSPGNIRATDLSVKDNIIYAASQSGVYVSTDFGESWEEENAGLNESVIYEMAAYDNNLYACPGGNGVYSSSDKGLSWENKVTDPEIPGFSTILPQGETIYGIYMTAIRVAVSHDGGANWESYYNILSNVTPTCLYAANDALLAGTVKGIYTSADSGKTFTEIDKNLNKTSITKISGNNRYLFASSRNSLLQSSDNGKSWTNVNYNFDSPNLNGVVARDSIVVAYNYEGWMYISSDYGENWKTVNQPFLKIGAVCIVGKCIFAGASNDNLYLSKDIGNSWRPVGNVFNKNTITRIVADDEYVYASTYAGIYKAKLDDFGVFTSVIDESAALFGPELRVYPNPAADFITIVGPAPGDRLEIFATNGEKILTAENPSSIDIRSLSPGLYIARLSNRQISSFSKFIVIR